MASRTCLSLLLFHPIFAAHQGRQAKQDQTSKPDDGRHFDERSEFGVADAFERHAIVNPHLNGNSAEYAAKPP